MRVLPIVDLDIECQIDWQAHRLHTAKTPEERHEALVRLRKLYAMRRGNV